MREILWFRRDLRINDNAVLSKANNEVLPIFIFDKNILDKLSIDDKRISFIFKEVLRFKKELQNIGLNLAIFYAYPTEVFTYLKGYTKVIASIDFDNYAKERDKNIEKIIKFQRVYDSFLLYPANHLKSSGSPYTVFTPFFKALKPLWENYQILYKYNENLRLSYFDYEFILELKDNQIIKKDLSLQSLGFKAVSLPNFLYTSPHKLLKEFKIKIKNYSFARDFFYKNATSNLSTFLRFGIISSKEILNTILDWKREGIDVDKFIGELFWREFYNYILFHFPQSEFENFNAKSIPWINNMEHFHKWSIGETGIKIVDASMRYINTTGIMHNRLRMVVASFLTKNLLIDWRLGEAYFAKKLLDYEVSSNVGSWQWCAGTGADAMPYFRIFNPLLQAKKFDEKEIFINSIIKESYDIKPIVDLKTTRLRAIEAFKTD